VQRLRQERGAVSVVVALLMLPLIGFGALAVDVGAIYVEQQRLQNGADAAALAIAQDCALGNCQVPADTAATLALANHAGSLAGVPEQTVTTGTREVTVVNRSLQEHWLAPALGFDSSHVDAAATAGWDPLDAARSALPLAFSLCEFRLQTGGGLPSGTVERVIRLSKDAATSCTGPSNNVVPGGFGWVETDADGSCAATSRVGLILASDTGNVVPNACKEEAYLQSLVGTTVLLPIFTEFGGTGNNAWYRVYSYAAFHVNGYFFSNKYSASPGACGNDQCVRGYFTRFVALSEPTGTVVGAPDLGARIVNLTR
jgi:putative Flp pilus-assembly TadE/G-like protein